MRSLAQRLGSGTATLYRHFASRSELVAVVVDRMLGEGLDMRAIAALPWQQACMSFAQHMFDALSAARQRGVPVDRARSDGT